MFIIIGSKQQLSKLNEFSIRVGSTDVFPVNTVRNLGSRFDSNLSMSMHINKLCSTAFFYVTPVLYELHCLPVRFRISLLGQSPQYISNLISVRNQSAYHLRSNDGLILRKMLTSFGDRSFSVATPTLWTALPISLRKSKTVQQFKSLLKTYLFRLVFNSWYY